MGYTGHLTHPATGMVLTWFRAYDPEHGRWLSRDQYPKAEKSQGPHLYAYGNNDPVTNSDPDGSSVWDIVEKGAEDLGSIYIYIYYVWGPRGSADVILYTYIVHCGSPWYRFHGKHQKHEPNESKPDLFPIVMRASHDDFFLYIYK